MGKPVKNIPFDLSSAVMEDMYYRIQRKDYKGARRLALDGGHHTPAEARWYVEQIKAQMGVGGPIKSSVRLLKAIARQLQDQPYAKGKLYALVEDLPRQKEDRRCYSFRMGAVGFDRIDPTEVFQMIAPEVGDYPVRIEADWFQLDEVYVAKDRDQLTKHLKTILHSEYIGRCLSGGVSMHDHRVAHPEMYVNV